MKSAAVLTLLLLAPFACASSEVDDTVLVSRGNAKVTLSMLDAYVAEAPADMRSALLASPKRKEQILTQLLVIDALAQEVRAAGLADKPELKARLELASTRLLAQFRTEALQAEAQIDADALARERYLSNPDRYKAQETVTVRHILVEALNRSEAAAKARLDEVIAKLDAGGDFAALAREYSDDTGSAAEGGTLPPATRTELDKQFADAAFQLSAPGERSGPVRSTYGFHIIQLIEHTPPKARPFEDVRDELVAQIKAEHAERVIKRYTDSLNAQSAVVDEEAVAGLPERYQRLYGGAAPAAGDGEAAGGERSD